MAIAASPPSQATVASMCSQKTKRHGPGRRGFEHDYGVVFNRCCVADGPGGVGRRSACSSELTIGAGMQSGQSVGG